MNVKQGAGIVLFLVGLGMLFTSHYITGQVLEGKNKIENAQSKVNTGKKLFSLTPVTKQVGQGVTQSAQQQINAGREEVSYYEEVAYWLRIGGIASLIIGIGAIFLCRCRHPK